MRTEARQALDDALRLVVRGVLDVLSLSSATAGGLPTRTIPRFRREYGPEPGQVSFPHEERTTLDLVRLASVLFSLTERVPGFDELLATLESNDELRLAVLVDAAGMPIDDPGSRSWWLRQMVLQPFLLYYLELGFGPAWNDDSYDQVFTDLVRQLDGEPLPLRLLAPLAHVHAEQARIELDDSTAIVALSDDELSELFNSVGPQNLYGFQHMTMMDLTSWTHAVEHITTQEIAQFGVLPAASQRAIPDAVTTLRLLRESGAATTLVWTQRLRRSFSIGIGNQVGFQLTRSLFPFGGDLTLGEEDASTLRELYQRLRNVSHADTDAQRRFELALGRLNTSAERLSTEDRLIDYWVALETLFANDSRGEIAYRARTRVSRYVTDEVDDRKQIAQKLSRSYDRRSKVVHGDRPKADLPDLTTKTGEILRRALCLLLETGKPIDFDSLDLG